MNVLQTISLQFKKIIDKLNRISSLVDEHKRSITQLEVGLANPEFKKGTKREYIEIPQSAFNNNGNAFTDNDIRFSRSYSKPLCTVHIVYKSAAMPAVHIAPYSVHLLGCRLRYIAGNKKDIGVRYTVLLKVEEMENKS